MKIGVFGDSFCNKLRLNDNPPSIWYNFLQQDYGHDIDCFGEAGSSIVFSAQLIEQRATDYDLVIWCVTTPGRFSFPEHEGPWHGSYHITSASDRCNTTNIDLANKHQACVDYLKYVFEWPTENLIGRSIVSYLQTQFSNIMIIPCFPGPLEAEFNLYDLSQREIDHYFPGKEFADIFKNYYDTRVGHLTLNNQKLLARFINDNLAPGLFQTNYDLFLPSTVPLEEIFKPR